LKPLVETSKIGVKTSKALIPVLNVSVADRYSHYAAL